jgi:hypothetical protein
MFDGLKIHEKHGSQPMFKRVTVRLFPPNFTNTANTTTSDYLCLHLCAGISTHNLSPPLTAFCQPLPIGPHHLHHQHHQHHRQFRLGTTNINVCISIRPCTLLKLMLCAVERSFLAMPIELEGHRTLAKGIIRCKQWSRS